MACFEKFYRPKFTSKQHKNDHLADETKGLILTAKITSNPLLPVLHKIPVSCHGICGRSTRTTPPYSGTQPLRSQSQPRQTSWTRNSILFLSTTQEEKNINLIGTVYPNSSFSANCNYNYLSSRVIPEVPA